MNELIKILMERDGLSESEARSQAQEIQETLLELIEDGADLCEIEEEFSMMCCLEPDYLMGLIF